LAYHIAIDYGNYYFCGKKKVIMKLTNNFSKSEFESKCGRQMPQSVLDNIKKVAESLQVLRDELKRPISITSGYRSPEHNAKVKGAKNSQHILGTAVDIKVEGMTPIQVAAAIEKLIKEKKMPQGGIGIYRSWVHYDLRGKKARW
jgi:uncharacterized protein YcbK (DUF882 family)